MKQLLFSVFASLTLFSCAAHADDDAAQCASNAGSFLTGTVSSAPKFRHGHQQRGVELSHTLLSIQADQDGQTYMVAVDNVFAAGYDEAGESVPAPLNTINVGDRVELCGQLFPEGGGIHWVHTDCGNQPTPTSPDGWVKVVAADGTVGPNLEASQEYCSIFGRSMGN